MYLRLVMNSTDRCLWMPYPLTLRWTVRVFQLLLVAWFIQCGDPCMLNKHFISPSPRTWAIYPRLQFFSSSNILFHRKSYQLCLIFMFRFSSKESSVSNNCLCIIFTVQRRQTSALTYMTKQRSFRFCIKILTASSALHSVQDSHPWFSHGFTTVQYPLLETLPVFGHLE